MTELVVKLGYTINYFSMFTWVNLENIDCLGCKRSLVQIQSRRPSKHLKSLDFSIKTQRTKTRLKVHRSAPKCTQNRVQLAVKLGYGQRFVGQFFLARVFARIHKAYRINQTTTSEFLKKLKHILKTTKGSSCFECFVMRATLLIAL